MTLELDDRIIEWAKNRKEFRWSDIRAAFPSETADSLNDSLKRLSKAKELQEQRDVSSYKFARSFSLSGAARGPVVYVRRHPPISVTLENLEIPSTSSPLKGYVVVNIAGSVGSFRF